MGHLGTHAVPVAPAEKSTKETKTTCSHLGIRLGWEQLSRAIQLDV